MLGLATAACAGGRAVGSGEEGEAPEALMDEGRTVFLELAEPSCALCHTLGDAGATGVLGPNLDELKPDLEIVRAAVTTGVGVMPAQGHLTEQQIQALASYVSQAAGSLD